MKQVFIKQGGIAVEEVPAPGVEPGAVLVRVEYSCISVGTEMSGLKSSNLPLWKRALQRPEDVKKVIGRVYSHGLRDTRRLVKQKLDTAHPLGYSASGEVIAVGDDVLDIAIGDKVACAGGQSAYHAEIVSVPRNLVACVPDGLALDQAATVTLGAIALQGVRRAAPTLGETYVVIGLGILGQLTQQILRANGVRVIGTDLDTARIDQALTLGMDFGIDPTQGGLVKHVLRLTDGYGADGVIITAATSSDEVLSTAFKACRRKGRVVLVGDVGLDIDRADIYEKELDFLVSTSYGPGRYDRTYEEKGLDYPLAYVRWTENRNMEAFLRLVADGRVDVSALIQGVYPVDAATEAYAALKGGGEQPLALLLSYPGDKVSLTRRTLNPAAPKGRDQALRLAVIGAGGFATGTLLPIIKDLGDDYTLAAVVTRQGHHALSVAQQFGAGEASTDFESVLADADIDAVLIATRHNLHGAMVLAALQAGKHVLVEKPLCLKPEELTAIEDFYADAGDAAPVLMTGFNRRFSPYATAVKQALQDRSGPMIINYRVNAGEMSRDHWVHNEEGGGRNLGEACHFYDLFTDLTGSRVETVEAQALRPQTGSYGRNDNFVATMTFEDGSVATLTYTALGADDHPKERMDVYVDGSVLSIEDYKSFSVSGGQAKSSTKAKPFTTRSAEKGHREELAAFARVVREGGVWPMPLWQQIQATAIAFSVDQRIAR